MRKYVQAAIDLLTRRHLAWQRAFSGPDGEIIDKQLAKFCRRGVSAFDPDPIKMAYMLGRQSVDELGLNYRFRTPDQLALRYQAATFEDKDNG